MSVVWENGLPVVDFGLNDYQTMDKVDDKKRLSEALYDAFKNTGFVYLKNFGISQSTVNEMRRKSKQFFDLPEEIKRRYLTSAENYGWVPQCKEGLDPTKPVDLKESLNLRCSKPCPDEEIPGFKQTADSFSRQCRSLVGKILKMFAIKLNLEDDEFFAKCHNMTEPYNQSMLRLVHYPPVTHELEAGQLRCGEHTDWGSITLLFQDDVGGLEVATRGGEWVPVRPLPNTVLVNIADMMQRWTADELPSH